MYFIILDLYGYNKYGYKISDLSHKFTSFNI